MTSYEAYQHSLQLAEDLSNKYSRNRDQQGYLVEMHKRILSGEINHMTITSQMRAATERERLDESITVKGITF